MESSIRYSWSLTLTPTREGRFTVPALTIRAGNEAVGTTQPRLVVCSRGAEDGRGVVEISPERITVYRGEVFTVGLGVVLDATLPLDMQGKERTG
jgi:hypothetical protein